MKENRLNASQVKTKAYTAFSFALVIIISILFTFPLYWIITGAFKTGAEINATTPVWWHLCSHH